MTHADWWEQVGSGMPPLLSEDAHEHVRRVTAACWPVARLAIFEAEAAQIEAPLLAARVEAEALAMCHEGRIDRLETLLRRALVLMNRWQVFYGDADHCMRNDLPLPPAGQVEWAEDVDAVLGPNVN